MVRDIKEKTLGDYLVIAICPLLIMALVGSTAFFVLEIGYQGQWMSRLQWTLFWFVLAAVLISRVSIEQGSTYANVYGFLLALVTGAQIYRLVGVTLVGWGLLAFIWWCTSKLTWDCTLVDEEEDASGEGLLQVAGLERHDSELGEAENKEAAPSVAWWKRMFQRNVKRAGKPHAPGSWVIYFSLIALPAFGIGQMFFAATDLVRREYGFKLLWIYVGAALGLLLGTSFLGLRRYLRQRSLPMPASMAGLWMVLGTALAGAIMLACLLLPRPGESGIFSTMVNQVATEVANQASKYAVLTGNAAQGEGRRIGSGDGEAKEESQDSGKQEGDGKKKEQAKTGGGGNETSPNAKGQSQQNNPGQSPQLNPLQRNTSWIADAIKWLIYGLIAGGIAYVLYRQRRDVLNILRAMWTALTEMFWSLFSWQRRQPRQETKPGVPATPMQPMRRFGALTNPFTSGTATEMSPEELVVVTFEALEVWAAERGFSRPPDETPLEFARKLAREAPAIAAESRTVARLYTRMLYAEYHPNTDCAAELARLWEALETLNWNMHASAQQPVEPVSA